MISDTPWQVLVVMPENDNRGPVFCELIEGKFPEARVILYSADISLEVISGCQYVLAWKPDPDIWTLLPCLKLIQSIGAGVDHLNLDSIGMPEVKLSRFVDPNLGLQMANYVLAQILSDYFDFEAFNKAQLNGDWLWKEPEGGKHVVILGLGEIGRVVATHLIHSGFRVSSWSNSVKGVSGIREYQGLTGLDDVLPRADYLINLLPLTKHTLGLLDKTFLQKLNKQCCLINVGRGATIDDKSLINRLNSGNLRKAILDVFSIEPLPVDNPFWKNSRVVITPHIASLSDPEAVVDLFIDNILRVNKNQPPRYEVDLTKGY